MQQPKPQPTGTRLIHLKDIPLAQRLEALTQASAEAQDENEALEMMDLVLEPGDASARVAA